MIEGQTYIWRDIWTYMQTDIVQTDTHKYKWMEGQEIGWKYIQIDIWPDVSKDLFTDTRMDRWTERLMDR